jgi:hypothetical protein
MNNSQDNGAEWALWEHRHNSVQEMIASLESQIEAADGVGRTVTFQVLLAQLAKFADAQFKFLHAGLDLSGGSGGYLEPSPRYPRDFVMKSTLDQVAFDLVVIQSAWHQRVLAKQDDKSPMARTLAIADRLAYSAVQPAFRYGLLPFKEGEVTVLTYFQKAPHIRMIPYAPVALIGLPFSALGAYEQNASGEADAAGDQKWAGGAGNAVDLLAIPHEIGHYVFQHGSSGNSRLQLALADVLKGQPEWLHNWAEEIFADVYGCLIAGPVIVRDFLELSRAGDIASLLDDDNEHPTPVLRPLLYVDTLRLLARKANGTKEQKQALRDIAEGAERRWNEFRGRRGKEHIQERRKIVRKAVNKMFDMLVGPGSASIDRLWSQPTVDPLRPVGYDDLYERFYQDVTSGQLFDRLEQVAPEDVEMDPNLGNEGEVRRVKERDRTAPPELDTDCDTPLQRLPTLQWLDRIRGSLPEADNGGVSQALEAGNVEEVSSLPVPADTAGESTDVTGDKGRQIRIPQEVWTLVVSMNGWATDGPQTNPDPKVT